MPRSYQPKNKYRNYDQSTLDAAVLAIQAGDQNPSSASTVYGIPRKTLSNRINNPGTPRRAGGTTIFTAVQEDEMALRLQYMENRGFPLSIERFLELSYEYACKLNRRRLLQGKIPNNWHINNMCSRDWWFSTNFYNELEEIYNNTSINDFPQLIYNIDETGLSSVPGNSNKVIATKGSRAVHSIQVGDRGSLTTVIPAVSASGECLPPFLIFKGKAPTEEIKSVLKNKGISCTSTKSGYIDTEVFLEFLAHFQSLRAKIAGKKCILLLDGHNSHFSIEAIEYAMNNDIEMICLPPHSSHRMQPLDTHFNKALKSLWAKTVAEFLRASDSLSLKRTDFVQLFFPVWQEMQVKRGLIVDSFSYSGLYPLNKKAVSDKEYSKSLAFLGEQELSPAGSNAASTSETPSSTSSNTPSIRSVFKSPQKSANLTHIKPHHASAAKILQAKKRSEECD